jgi:sugar phosphate isomerase/epimerase
MKTPYVGTAIPIRLIGEYRSWLLEGQRDLEIQDAYLPQVLDGNWKVLARQAREALEGYSGRIGIHGPFVGYTFEAGFDPKLSEAISVRLRQALDFAKALGASHMVIHSPFASFGANPFTADSPRTLVQELIERTHAVLKDVLPKAEEACCALVIENIEDKNPEPLLELVRSFDSEFVRMSLDTGHASITSRYGGPTPDQWVREAGALLGHVHLHDNDGAADRHWAPGDGDINWFALFEALAESDAHPRLLLEVHGHSRTLEGAAYLSGRGFVR